MHDYYVKSLYIPIATWNSFASIEFKFFNNCGDTCTKTIAVVQIPPQRPEGSAFALDQEYFVEIMPVPAHESVTIKYHVNKPESGYSVRDMLGRIMHKGILANNRGEMTLDISNWSSGWYILDVDDPILDQKPKVIIKD